MNSAHDEFVLPRDESAPPPSLLPEPRPAAARDPLWYKDAVIYALHVKTFYDGNGDGIGDFRGLTEKLGYLQALGVTCLWLLPFYVSPLGDDGYDIADYERVDPRFGTLEDFKEFLGAAHRHGLRVITELVINHTSEAHPWFQAARLAPSGTPERDVYVWNDTDERYRDARVIFTDAEASNWTWDPLAGAFYWHRFFHHQPDLNFHSPLVRRAVVNVMRFWLDLGVDGLRLDAIPYLFEREGTDCENLPETHAFVRELRAVVDREYPGRVLLAEANNPPEDARAYFGDGHECQMIFHFALAAQLFRALFHQDALPIVEIVRQTVDVPSPCQWATYLRNHDELSLSALSHDERQHMLDGYAPRPVSRLNGGIRRRLAPLLDNERGRLELAHALLLSLPGSPVLYYGDEIGMGDDVRLGDRHGLRTPMQWSADVGGGFSTAAASQLVVPPLEDPHVGYPAVNVAAQDGAPDSLLHAVKRLIRLRRQHRAFGRGSIGFLECGNRHVLAFVRRHEDDAVACVSNLAATAQTVSVRVPGAAEDRQVTLGPHGFRWFAVQASGAASR